MTATVTLDGQSLTQTFSVTVIAATAFTNAELLEDAKVALTLPSGIVESDLDLPLTAANGTTVVWSSNNTDVIANDGTVTRPAEGAGDATVTLTATFSIGTETDVVVDYIVVVPELEPVAKAVGFQLFATIAALHASTLGDDISFQGIVVGLFDSGYYLTDGTNALSVYSPGYDDAITFGTTVLVEGAYGKYNSTFQITDVINETIISQGGTNPLPITVATVGEIIAMDSSDKLLAGKFFTVTGTIELRIYR
jgi:hypothetical protein